MPRWCRVPPTPKGIRSRSSSSSTSCCCCCCRCRCRCFPPTSISRLYFAPHPRPCLFSLAALSLARSFAHPLDLDLVSTVHQLAHHAPHSHLPPLPRRRPSCCSRTASIRISSSISSPASAFLHIFSSFTTSPPPNYRTGIFYSSPRPLPSPPHLFAHRASSLTPVSVYDDTPLSQVQRRTDDQARFRLCFFLFPW